MIPRIAHFIWSGSEPPAGFHENVDEFRLLHPAWEIKVHTLWKGSLIDSIRTRARILKDIGGVSISGDVRFVRSMDDLLQNSSFASRADRSKRISGCVLGSIPNSKMINRLLDEISHRTLNGDREAKSYGTEALTQVYRQFSDSDFKIYPEHYFNLFRRSLTALRFLQKNTKERMTAIEAMWNRIPSYDELYAVHLLDIEQDVKVAKPSPPAKPHEHYHHDDEEPDLTQKAINLGGAISRTANAFIRGETTFVSLAERERRLGICRGDKEGVRCQFFNGKSCKKCGCRMKIKSFLAKEKCPIGKW